MVKFILRNKQEISVTLCENFQFFLTSWKRFCLPVRKLTLNLLCIRLHELWDLGNVVECVTTIIIIVTHLFYVKDETFNISPAWDKEKSESGANVKQRVRLGRDAKIYGCWLSIH